MDVSILSRMERSGKANPYRVPSLAKGYCLSVEAFEALLNKSPRKKGGVAK